MTQEEIVATCNHAPKKIRTRHGAICVDCWPAYFAAKAKTIRQPRTEYPAWGDYATIAMINRRRT